MKKTLLLFFLCLPLLSAAQQFNYFDQVPTNLPAYIDLSQPNNIWQIGQPNKVIFNAAYTAPNVIITDTVNAHPSSNLSSFHVTINSQTMWSSPFFILVFYHKMQVSQGHAGGWIEASYDAGATWDNVATSATHPIAIIGDQPTDTLFNGELGYGANYTNGWLFTTLCWGILSPAAPQDSVLVKFNFTTDGSGELGEGWMIDQMEAKVESAHTLDELKEMSAKDFLIPRPNPFINEINLFYRLEKRSNVNFTLYNFEGKEVLQKDLGLKSSGVYTEELFHEDLNLPQGIYILEMRLDHKIIRKKILKR